MKRIKPASWMDDDRALWARIAAHEFEAEGAILTFAGRLARDHGWSSAQARAAIDEYRRFCFLAVRGLREVTPSEEVDEVWHQHLTYSRDYWKIWCHDVLRHDLHHGPTGGGPAESKRFAEQYAATLAAYEAWFGPPPPKFWPGTAERFGRPRFLVVDRATHIVVPFPRGALTRWRRLTRALRLGVLLAIGFVRPASAATLNVLDWGAIPFLTLYVIAAGLSFAAAVILPPLLRKETIRPNGRSQLTPLELALLAGGTARAADVLILDDIAAGLVVLQVLVSHLGPFSSRTDVLAVGEQIVTRAWLASEKSDEIASLQHGLVEEGLLSSAADRQTYRRSVLLLVGPVVLLGLAKVGLGVERGKPVGILIFLLGVTAIATFVVAGQRWQTSRAGRRLIANYKVEHSRALRAPRFEELIGAFAIMGATALAGTAFEAYGRILKSADADGGGGEGCGGGGGGGCGGCSAAADSPIAAFYFGAAASAGDGTVATGAVATGAGAATAAGVPGGTPAASVSALTCGPFGSPSIIGGFPSSTSAAQTRLPRGAQRTSSVLPAQASTLQTRSSL